MNKISTTFLSGVFLIITASCVVFQEETFPDIPTSEERILQLYEPELEELNEWDAKHVLLETIRNNYISNKATFWDAEYYPYTTVIYIESTNEYWVKFSKEQPVFVLETAGPHVHLHWVRNDSFSPGIRLDVEGQYVGEANGVMGTNQEIRVRVIPTEKVYEFLFSPL